VVVRVADKQVVFSDDFEVDRGWRRNPTGKDTATLGLWERATPQPTADNGAKQLGAAASGRFDLVTGAIAGGSAGVNDVDGGVTSIQSPVIVLPPDGSATLSLSYYFAHLDNASPADFFRVQVVGDTGAPVTVIEELGSATNRDAAFLRRSVDITAFAGHSVRVLIQAGDFEGASLVEAAVDDIVIERQ
jgi:aminopeptidase S